MSLILCFVRYASASTLCMRALSPSRWLVALSAMMRLLCVQVPWCVPRNPPGSITTPSASARPLSSSQRRGKRESKVAVLAETEREACDWDTVAGLRGGMMSTRGALALSLLTRANRGQIEGI